MSLAALDLFSGAGGASVGYWRAGFDRIVGIDIEFHPHYPMFTRGHEFVQEDALKVLADVDYLDQFDFIHASPPCQGYSALRHSNSHREYPLLIDDVREALTRWGGAYIIENVVGAPLIDPVMLCGSMFGLGARCRDRKYRQLRRHRLFESNIELTPPGPCKHDGQAMGVYGSGGIYNGKFYMAARSEARQAMGIYWMRHSDITQAIPPAYSEHLGRQVIRALI